MAEMERAAAVVHLALLGLTKAQRLVALAVLEEEGEEEEELETVGLVALEALAAAAVAAVEQVMAVTLKRPNPPALLAGKAAGPTCCHDVGSGGGGGAGLGGAIFVRAGNLTLTNSDFISNSATNGQGGKGGNPGTGRDGQGKGGAIFIHTEVAASVCSNDLQRAIQRAAPSAPQTIVMISMATSATSPSSSNRLLPRSGRPMTPAVTVKVLDPCGNLDTNSSAIITLTLDNNPGNAILSGTTSVVAVNGIATFNNFSLNKLGTWLYVQGRQPKLDRSDFQRLQRGDHRQSSRAHRRHGRRKLQPDLHADEWQRHNDL